jgi:hypothetical protein
VPAVAKNGALRHLGVIIRPSGRLLAATVRKVGRIQRSLPARAEHALHDLLNGRTDGSSHKIGGAATMGCFFSSIEPVRARTSRSPSLTPPSSQDTALAKTTAAEATTLTVAADSSRDGRRRRSANANWTPRAATRRMPLPLPTTRIFLRRQAARGHGEAHERIRGSRHAD